jgi:hypothetical protein
VRPLLHVWLALCQEASGDRAHVCTGTALTPATSAPGLRSPLPHLRRDCAHPCHICAGTALTLPTLHIC